MHHGLNGNLTPRQFQQCPIEGFASGQLFEQEGIEQFVNHARKAGEDTCQVGTGRAHPHVELHRGRIKAEQFPEHSLGPNCVTYTAERGERCIGIGRLGNSLKQLGSNPCQVKATASS